MKRIISLLLTVLMIFTSMPAVTFAAESEPCTITVETVNGAPGITVDVSVNIENNPGILGMTMKLEYDESALTLVEATNGEAFEVLKMTPPKNYKSGCNFVWYADDIDSSDIADGSILDLSFTVSEEAVFGEEFDIIITCQNGSVFDADLDPVDVVTVDGMVRVMYVPGDVSGDDKVAANDLILLSRYIADGNMNNNADGYNVNINELAADVDESNTIAAKDLILISRFISDGCVTDPEGYNVELKPSPIGLHKHTIEYVAAVDATCTKDGNEEYWYCDGCKKCFSDENGKNKIDIESTVIDALGHETTYTPRKEATSYADGNIEYWTCTVCDKIFSDSEYKNEITLEATVIEKITGNTYTVYFKDASNGKATFVSLDNQETTVSSITKDKTEKFDFPQIKKYGFSALCLTDSNGDIITGIEAGTTGNVDVYVHWMSNRNQTYPVKNLGKPQIIEDQENGQIYFVYEIGEIDNVPIETIHYIGEIDEELTHESTTVSIKNTATQNATAIAQTVSNATTNSASMTLSDEWTNKYSIDQEWAKSQDQEQVEQIKEYIENGGQWNISSQFGGEDTYTHSFGSSSSSSHKKMTGKVDASGSESGSNSESGSSEQLSASIGTNIGGGLITADISGETSSYKKENDSWKSTKDTEESSGTENYNQSTSYSDISKSYTNSWNTEEGYTQSHNIGTETDISNALRIAITENSQKSYSDEYKKGSLTTESQDVTQSEGREYSSAITFSTSEEVTKSTTTKQTFKTKGFYRYIRAGKLDVYAVVGYDIKNYTYFTSTFSMFEKETKEIWDFSEDGTFTDGEIGVLPFEVPYEVEEYVLGQTAYTNGLLFNYAQGAITGYDGTAKNVLIPNYYSKNGDMTYIKALGTDPQTKKPVFAGNENIEVIRLSKYITSIPDGAFEGCTNLKTVIAPGVTSIGNNAFKGCENLNKFIVSTKVTSLGENAFVDCPEVVVNASNSSVARAATTAGAKKITINAKVMNGTFAEVVKDAEGKVIADYSNGYTIEIGDIEYFAFYGGNKTFNNVKLKSAADETYIEKATFTSDSGTAFNISSENITFKGVNVKNNNVAMLSQFDGAKILIAEDSTFGALTTDTTTKVITRNIELSNVSGETAQWVINGSLYIYGNTSFIGGHISEADKIEKISDTEFEKYVSGICNVTFDANGGSIEQVTKQVYFGDAYGTLPTPTRTGFTFNGWYTAKAHGSGTKITADTEVTVTSNHTLYAQWSTNEYSTNWSAPIGVSITVNRTSSPNRGATTGTLTSGATVYYGDVLSITYTANTGYTLATNGKTSITVTGNVTSSDIYATATVNSYKASWSAVTGTTITVKRTSSPLKGASTETLTSGATVYYGDVLSITYTANTGYTLATNGKTSITVAGDVTSSDIYATATANNYTYNVVYESSNGTSLGSTTATKAFDTTNTIVPETFAGYDTPDAQSITWDSTSEKTITFVYEPTAVDSTAISQKNILRYIESGYAVYASCDAVIEHRNRTANSVEIRVNWTLTYPMAHGISSKITCGGASTNTVISKYKADGHEGASCQATSNWITVPLSTTQATNISLDVRLWQTNSNGTDITSSNYYGKTMDDYEAEWSVAVPAF